MLSESVLQKIKLHYTEEYQKTLVKLKELEGVLQELGGVEISYSNDFTGITETPQDRAATITPSAITAKESPEKPTKRAYKKRAKKRGRKSIWGDFILKRLKATHKPLSYDDLTNHAIVMMKLDQSEFDKTRKSIVSAVFNLRNKQQKLATVAKKGTRDKYVLLKAWVDEKNKMLSEFQEKL